MAKSFVWANQLLRRQVDKKKCDSGVLQEAAALQLGAIANNFSDTFFEIFFHNTVIHTCI